MSLNSLKAVCVLLVLGLVVPSSIAQNSIQKGIDFYQSGDLRSATGFFSDYLKKHQKDHVAYYYLGRVYFDQNEYEDATDQFEEAAELAPDSANYYLWLGHSYGRRAQNAGKLKQPSLVRSSRNNYEKAIELSPRSIGIRQSTLEFYLQIPGFLGGGRDKAEEQAEAISQISELNGLLSKATIHQHYQEAAGYEQTLKLAVEKFPEAMAPYYLLSNFYYSQQQFQQVLDITDQQLRQEDDLAPVYVNRGNAQDQLGLYDDAMTSFLKALELDVSLEGVHYQIGKVAAKSGRYLETGEQHILTFLALENRFDDLTRSWAYYRYGTILEHMGDKSKARTQYELALNLNSEHQDAKQALARLDQ